MWPGASESVQSVSHIRICSHLLLTGLHPSRLSPSDHLLICKVALTQRAAVRVTGLCCVDPETPSVPRRPSLPIRGLFASSSAVAKVQDDFLRVLSLAGTRFSPADGEQEQTSEGQRGEWLQRGKEMQGPGWASSHPSHPGRQGGAGGDLGPETPHPNSVEQMQPYPARPTCSQPADFHTKSPQLVLRRLNYMCKTQT